MKRFYIHTFMQLNSDRMLDVLIGHSAQLIQGQTTITVRKAISIKRDSRYRNNKLAYQLVIYPKLKMETAIFHSCT